MFLPQNQGIEPKKLAEELFLVREMVGKVYPKEDNRFFYLSCLVNGKIYIGQTNNLEQIYQIDIARKYKINKDTLKRILKDNNIDPKTRKRRS